MYRYLTIAIALLALGLWFRPALTDDTPPLPEEIPLANAARTVVSTQAIASTPYQATLDFYARTKADKRLTITNRVAGEIENIRVREGERVAAGAVLLTLKAEGSPARLAAARAFVKKATLDYEAQKNMQAQGLNAASDVATAELSLQQAREALTTAELENAHKTIRAPFAGVVENFEWEQGQFIDNGTALATLMDTRHLQFSAQLGERDITELRVDMPAAVSVEGVAVASTITFISAYSNRTIPTYTLEGRFENTHDWKVGRAVSVVVPLPVVDAYNIPVSAIVIDDDGNPGVFTAEPDSDYHRAVFHPIRLIGIESNRVWLTGLEGVANQAHALMTIGQNSVADGETVTVRRQSR